MGRDLERQTRLARTARADEGDQRHAGLSQLFAHLGELPLPSHEVRTRPPLAPIEYTLARLVADSSPRAMARRMVRSFTLSAAAAAWADNDGPLVPSCPVPVRFVHADPRVDEVAPGCKPGCRRSAMPGRGRRRVHGRRAPVATVLSPTQHRVHHPRDPAQAWVVAVTCP